jgi:hypothetical protein
VHGQLLELLRKNLYFSAIFCQSPCAGVLKEEERLAGLFKEHLAGPAIEAAEPAQSSYGVSRPQ